MMRLMHQAMFMKNVAMLGGALLVAYRGAGPVSLDERADQPVRETTSVRAVA
jgi:putative oxidoreductase